MDINNNCANKHFIHHRYLTLAKARAIRYSGFIIIVIIVVIIIGQPSLQARKSAKYAPSSFSQSRSGSPYGIPGGLSH
jgi:hypothetical protein